MEYQNITTINLGFFENVIKERYNISKNDSLIILKIEKYIDNLLIPLIEYEIFHPITKKKINLNYYKDLDNSSYILLFK